jgi:hypothetical protein
MNSTIKDFETQRAEQASVGETNGIRTYYRNSIHKQSYQHLHRSDYFMSETRLDKPNLITGERSIRDGLNVNKCMM